MRIRILAAAAALPLLVLAAGCLDGNTEKVHLTFDLHNCGDTEFRSVCVSKGVAEDSPFFPFIDSSFRVTLTGSLRLHGKDTSVSGWRVPADFGPGEQARIELPAGVEKSAPPLEVVGCVRDEGGAHPCDTLRHADL